MEGSVDYLRIKPYGEVHPPGASMENVTRSHLSTGTRLARTFLLTLGAALAACASTPPAFRLPDSARPLSCALELTIRPDQERFQGLVEIVSKCPGR